MKFKIGDQIHYIPTHAAGDPRHPDVEDGFVVSPAGGKHYLCRFFRRDSNELRTRANSERTPAANMTRNTTRPRPDMVVDALMIELGYMESEL